MHWIHPMVWLVLAQVEEFGDYEEFAEPVQRMSYLGWIYNALGPVYILTLPTLGLLAFVAACLVVAKNRRPADIASGVPFAAAPFVLGVFGVVHGMISSLQVIATSAATPALTCTTAPPA